MPFLAWLDRICSLIITPHCIWLNQNRRTRSYMKESKEKLKKESQNTQHTGVVSSLKHTRTLEEVIQERRARVILEDGLRKSGEIKGEV